MSVISVKNLTFGYNSAENVFENVSFQIDTSWRLGFIGRNGKGKTTFLKLLMGEYDYTGQIRADVQFEYFPYAVEDKRRQTRKVLKDIAGQTEDWILERELNLMGMDGSCLDREFCSLSGGEQAKSLLAAMFLKPNGFLLIDEPTNHLDMLGRERAADYLRTKQGFILVSHDRAFLDGCTDHVLSLERSGLTVQSGNFTSWYQNKSRQDAFEQAENQRLKKDIRRLEAASKQAGQWADRAERSKIGGGKLRKETKSIGGRAYIGEKSRKLQQTRKNMERRAEMAVEEKRGLLKNIEKTDSLRLEGLAYHAARLVEGVDLSLFYDNKQICGPITFEIGRGERVALEGRNGSGKSSLLKLICGGDVDFTGRFSIGSGLKISYIPQDASFLRGELDEYASKCGVDTALFKTLLRKLDFKREHFEREMQFYSDGQKKKVLLARSICERAHLYVWDEPLNYIDIFSRIQIEEMLSDMNGALLFVEHDRAFLDKIATRRLIIG